MTLPNKDKNLDHTHITTEKDICFRTKDSVSLSKTIYNGIVEFAVREYDLNYDNLELEQMKVLGMRLRYEPTASDSTKSRYGFYGEVLLDLILRSFFKTDVLLARGYMYDPLVRGEPKGFDAFHIIELNGDIQLWLGEAKFYVKYKKPVDDVLKKIGISLSDNYVNRNVLALIDKQSFFTTPCSRLTGIMNRWEGNPSINISKEIAKENITITYPIMIAYQPSAGAAYDDCISECLDYINDKISELSITIHNSFKYKIFFIFLPVDDVAKVKECVYKWIDSKEPLI